jgi:hypothetical protein
VTIISTPLEQELEFNYQTFTKRWLAEQETVVSELGAAEAPFLRSYVRIASLNGWREAVLEKSLSSESLNFFLEAQNDALVSHVLARMGSWRSALKSLRSAIENALFCLYYKDHPVELELWRIGKNTIVFAELITYFERHPLLLDLQRSATGLEIISKEYSILSRAVHGSAATFRMTTGGATMLWNSSRQSLGAWETREDLSLRGLNLLLLALFRESLSGTKHRGLRSVIGMSLKPADRARVRSALHVVL